MLSPVPLYYIIYHRLASALDGMDATELTCLLRQSRAANFTYHITGLLLYAGLTYEFVQVLEGPLDDVRQAYERIIRDSRHKHTFVLHEGEAVQRMFPDMAHGLRHSPSPRLV